MAKKRTVLVIEDEFALLEAIKMILGMNYTVITAEDGQSGLKAMAKKPDLVLLDLFLPEIDGFQVLEKAKADKKLADIPVVILSNCAGDADKKKAQKLGALDFWVKADLDLEEIDQRVGDVLADQK